MERQAAARAMDALLDGGSKLAASIEHLRGGLPDEEFKRYCLAVGQILASIQLDLMTVITREHPELDPDC